MAKGTNRLKEIFTSQDKVNQGFVINDWHVSQSIDAFTGKTSYDIEISGSLTVTGSIYNLQIPTASGTGHSVIVIDNITGEFKTTGSYGTGTSSGSGTSGTSGITGTSGTSGISGTSGTSGITGTSGTSGVSPTSSVSISNEYQLNTSLGSSSFSVIVGSLTASSFQDFAETTVINELAGLSLGTDFYVSHTFQSTESASFCFLRNWDSVNRKLGFSYGKVVLNQASNNYGLIESDGLITYHIFYNNR